MAEFLNNKILLVDDESYTLEFLSYSLSKNGFQVHTSNNGIDAIKQAKRIIPNIILLDVMMPEMDGIETCIELRKVRELKDTIIAFLSSRKEDYTQIVGFEAGADDYIKKPIRLQVLTTRLRALLKRVKRKEQKNVIEIDDMKIIKDKFMVVSEGKEFVFPKREFELLSLLADEPSKVYTRDEIFSQVWGDDTLIGDRTINVHVSRIRNKLGSRVIKTVKGVGYSFY